MAGILILGGRSDIGGEIATRLAPGNDVVLAARGEHGMEDLVHALSTTAASVHVIDFDACNQAEHRQVFERARALAGDINVAVVAFGILGDQTRAEQDEAHAYDIAVVDYAAQVSMLTVLASQMRSGYIVAFSSIAGWRARRANYVYGSTKAGLDAFCQGLADSLHAGPLALLTARPGFVIGSMTKGMKPAPLSVTPADVAMAVVDAMDKSVIDAHGQGTDAVQDSVRLPRLRSRTLWIPSSLRILAWIMRCVPRPLWRHMPR
ncbi:SDR family oxidoreductase [Corynebacterium flavescens]